MIRLVCKQMSLDNESGGNREAIVCRAYVFCKNRWQRFRVNRTLCVNIEIHVQQNVIIKRPLCHCRQRHAYTVLYSLQFLHILQGSLWANWYHIFNVFFLMELQEIVIPPGAPPQIPDCFGLNPPSQLVIGYQRLAFLNQQRKKKSPETM